MDSFTLFSAIWVFVFGAIIGSFLNVCILRIPRGESVIRPRSHCTCGQVIAWYDNIPLLSWVLLRGKARCCRSRISPRYFFVELLTAGAFLACWLSFEPTKAAAGMALCFILIGAAFIDWEHGIIPELFSIGGLLLGLALSMVFPSLHGITDPTPFLASLQSFGAALLGALIGSGLLFWIREVASWVLRKEAMGWGDISFIGAIGAFCGWQGAVFAIFGGAVIGTIGMSFFILLSTLRTKSIKRTATDHPTQYAWGQAVPFGPMLAVAAALYFFSLDKPIQAYFSSFSRLFTGS